VPGGDCEKEETDPRNIPKPSKGKMQLVLLLVLLTDAGEGLKESQVDGDVRDKVKVRIRGEKVRKGNFWIFEMKLYILVKKDLWNEISHVNVEFSGSLSIGLDSFCSRLLYKGK